MRSRAGAARLGAERQRLDSNEPRTAGSSAARPRFVTHERAQQRPVERDAGIGLAAGRHVAVPDDAPGPDAGIARGTARDHAREHDYWPLSYGVASVPSSSMPIE